MDVVLRFIAEQQEDDRERSSLWGFFDPASAGSLGYARAAGSVDSFSVDIPKGVEKSVYETCSQSALNDFRIGNGLGPVFTGIPGALPDRGPYVPAGEKRFLTVVHEWSACMAAQKLNYPDPLSALNDPRWRNGTVTTEQIAVAESDIDCKIKTNLVGFGLALQSAYDRQYISSHQKALAGYDSYIKSYLRSQQ